MTDRVRTLVVVLEDDYRVDDIEEMKKAISMMRGVQRVENGDVVSGSDHINREVVRTDLLKDLFEFVQNWKGRKKK